jgi:hypothetical protein
MSLDQWFYQKIVSIDIDYFRYPDKALVSSALRL